MIKHDDAAIDNDNDVDDMLQGGKYVYVARDPMDAFVSFYKFLPVCQMGRQIDVTCMSDNLESLEPISTSEIAVTVKASITVVT